MNEHMTSDIAAQLYDEKNSVLNSHSTSVAIFAIDYFLLICSYIIINFIRNHNVSISVLHLKLIVLLSLSWILVYFLSHKSRIYSTLGLRNAYIKIITSNVLLAYVISFAVLIKGLYAFSRGLVFGTLLFYIAMEAVFITATRFLNKEKRKVHDKINQLELISLSKTSVYLFANDFIYLISSFLIMTYYKQRTFEITDEYERILWITTAVWLTVSLFTKKFNKIKSLKYSSIFVSYVKSYVLTIFTMAVLLFVFRLFYYSRLHFIGTFSILLFLEIITSYLNYMSLVYEPESTDNQEELNEIKAILQQADLPMGETNKSNIPPIQVKQKLTDNLFYKSPQIFYFINKCLALTQFDESETIIFDTNTIYNIETVKKQSLRLFINLHKINNFKRVNRYFLEVHKTLKPNGFFISDVETNEAFRKRIFTKFPSIVATGIYFLHFIFKRVMPKLPVLDKIYFAVTRGKNRAMSKAEVLGRLYYTGFKIFAETEINGRYFFIAQCIKYPSVVKNPSYGPTVKLPRVGMNGEILFIYKFRTMFPYSEFLQEYIYEKNKLDSKGKFAGDFRLTGWGKIFRKFWIDELPQIINFLQGDLALFGVRALSTHYYNLYPRDLQELRIKFKPGLIPPYYADLPETFDEIIQSERTYLEEKIKAPIRTDITYLIRALYNIIIKRARSR